MAPRAAAARALTLLLALLAGGGGLARPSASGRGWPKVRTHPRPVNETHTVLSKGSLLKLDNATRCLDSSPAYYYFAPGSDPDKITTWLIYLPGKSWCYSPDSCFLMTFWEKDGGSSKKWPATLALDGLFSPDAAKNPYAGANMAYLGYCSGDAFLGSVNQTAAGYNFQGRRILRAFFTHLVTIAGLGRPYRINNAAAPHKVLLVGGGAGGMGMLLNLDDVAGWLLELGVLPQNFVLRGLLDAGLSLPLTPPGVPAAASPLAAAGMAVAYLNITDAQLSPACMAANSANVGACLFTSVRLAYTGTPVFVFQPLFDARVLHAGFGRVPPKTDLGLSSAELDYAAALRLATLTALARVKGGAGGALAPACVKGPVGMHPTAWGVKLSDPAAGDISSLRDALADWLQGGNYTAGEVLADACTEYGCGLRCRPNGGHPRNPDKLLTVAKSAVPRKSHKRLLRNLFRLSIAAAILLVLRVAYEQFNVMASDLPPMPLPLRAQAAQPRAAAAAPAREDRSAAPIAGEGTPLLTKLPASRAAKPGAAAKAKAAAAGPHAL